MPARCILSNREWKHDVCPNEKSACFPPYSSPGGRGRRMRTSYDALLPKQRTAYSLVKLDYRRIQTQKPFFYIMSGDVLSVCVFHLIGQGMHCSPAYSI